MPNINVSSDLITVFPSMNRSYNPRNARSFNEYNLTRLINQLTDTDSFIISDDTNTDFEFNIAGYYFKVNNYTTNIISNFTSPTEGNVIYAEIKVVSSDNELLGFDVSVTDPNTNATTTIYDGVSFKDANSIDDVVKKEVVSDGTINRLPLFTYSGTSWGFEPSSRIKFKSNSVLPPDIIDGGVD